MLVTAEVVSADDQVATIRLLDAPHYDPDQVLENGQVIEDLVHYSLALEAGQKGLFLIHPPGACIYVNPDVHSILGFAPESEGIYLCSSSPSFEGTTRETVVAAVLSNDCIAAVYELGIEADCEGTSGCCSRTSVSTHSGFLLLFLGMVLVGRKKA